MVKSDIKQFMFLNKLIFFFELFASDSSVDIAIITFIISQVRRLVSSSILMFCLSLH